MYKIHIPIGEISHSIKSTNKGSYVYYLVTRPAGKLWSCGHYFDSHHPS